SLAATAPWARPPVRARWRRVPALYREPPACQRCGRPRAMRPGRSPPEALAAPLGPGLDLLLDLLQVERAGRLARRIFLHGLQDLRGHALQRHDHEDPIQEPVVVGVRIVLGLLERVPSQVEEQGHAELRERLAPDAEGLAAILEEHDLPV